MPMVFIYEFFFLPTYYHEFIIFFISIILPMHVKQGVFIYVTMLSLYAVCSMLVCY